MRLRIEYFDHNEYFAAQLPRDGLVLAQPRSSDSPLPWHLVQLDVPVIYEQVVHTHLLLASRWEGYPLGRAEPTSVFILLVPPAHTTVADGFSYKQYRHVAWGMSHVIGA
jgi:hypothetical protein